MSILAVLWAPFSAVGRAFGRYWLGRGHDDLDGPDAAGWHTTPSEPGAVATAWRAWEPVVVLSLVATFAAVLAAGALTA